MYFKGWHGPVARRIKGEAYLETYLSLQDKERVFIIIVIIMAQCLRYI